MTESFSTIQEDKRQFKELPRFYKDFIGIGHQLQVKRKNRRKAQIEQRSIANRVLFLEKQQVKAQKSIFKKRQLYENMISTITRQRQESDEKQMLQLKRQREIERMKNENRFKRMMHRQVSKHSTQDMLSRNSLDYQDGKKRLIDGEERKRRQKLEDANEKRSKYLTLSLAKSNAKAKIDKFYKRKNKDHTLLYKQKIKKEENIVQQKQSTVKQLQYIEQNLRKRLQESTMRASQVDQMIGNLKNSRGKNISLSRLSLSSGKLNSSESKKVFKNKKQDNPMITSIEGQLINKNYSLTSRESVSKNNEQIQQKIEINAEEEKHKNSLQKVTRRRKNKHKNRYKEYQQF